MRASEKFRASAEQPKNDMKKSRPIFLLLAAGDRAGGVQHRLHGQGQAGVSSFAADKFFAAGKLDRAEIEYMNALRNGSKSPRTFWRLGVIYFNKAACATAAFLYRAIQLTTNDLDLHLKIGTSPHP